MERKATKVFVNYFNFLIAWNFHPEKVFILSKSDLSGFLYVSGTSLMGDNFRESYGWDCLRG